MKTILDTKLFSALALIMVLSIAPISSQVFAQSDDVQAETDVEVEQDINDEQQTDEREKIRELREKYRDQLKDERKEIRDKMKEERDAYRDQVKVHIDQLKDKKHALQDEFRPLISDISPDYIVDQIAPDREPDLTFTGDVSGWAVLGGVAYPTEMKISGDAYHAGKGIWQITATGEITVEGHTAILDLKGHARGNHVMLHGSGILSTNDEPTIRVQLRGHYAPTASGEEFAIAFTNAVVHNSNNGHRIPLALVGSVMAFPVSDIEIISEILPETDNATTIDEIFS